MDHPNYSILGIPGSTREEKLKSTRVKYGNFGYQVNSDSDLVCFIF